MRCKILKYRGMKQIRFFLRGLASVNLFGEGVKKGKCATDAENLAADWRAVGSDIRQAMASYNIVGA